MSGPVSDSVALRGPDVDCMGPGRPLFIGFVTNKATYSMYLELKGRFIDPNKGLSPGQVSNLAGDLGDTALPLVVFAVPGRITGAENWQSGAHGTSGTVTVSSDALSGSIEATLGNTAGGVAAETIQGNCRCVRS
jgi:hypothetical protein